MSKIPVVKTNKPTVDLALIDADVLRYELGAVQLDHPYIKGEKVPAPSSFVEGLVQDRIETILDRLVQKTSYSSLQGRATSDLILPNSNHIKETERILKSLTTGRLLTATYESPIHQRYGKHSVMKRMMSLALFSYVLYSPVTKITPV